MSDVVVRRVYDEPDPQAGARILVDRLWPRGLSKERAALDEWCKAVAPSPELRTWYGHDQTRYAEFTERYRDELRSGEQQEALQRLRQRARTEPLVLLTATTDPQISSAAILAVLLRD